MRMVSIIDKGIRRDLDSIDSIIIKEISSPKDIIKIIKSNPTLFEQWKEHEKQCEQAKNLVQ